MLAGIEMGGTKVVCGVGASPTEVGGRVRIPTTTPAETLGAVTAWLAGVGPVDAVGIASFGPIERRRGRERWGWITTTPKPGWSGVDVVGPIAAAAGAPVAWETDVNGAGFGEHRHGAGRDASVLVYLTIGTGLGGGLLVDGRPTPGLGHPEMGHVRPRRDPADSFPGACPFHGDCLEGLVCGPALAARFGRPAEEVGDAAVLDAVVPPLAAALADLVYTVAPDRIVIGGGIGLIDGLAERVRTAMVDLLADYGTHPEHGPGFVVPPALGGDAGLVGALCLAEDVA